jgi:hypothetical protein
VDLGVSEGWEVRLSREGYDLGLAQGRMDLPGAGNCGDSGEVIQSR